MAFMSSVYEFVEPDVRPERHGPSDFPDDLTMKDAPSFCARKDELPDHRLIPGKHPSRRLGVMVGVDYGEHHMVHHSSFRAAGNVEELEFYRLTIRRDLANHARPISGVAIMGQEQAISVHIKHGDRIVGSARPSRLMQDCVTTGSHPNCDVCGEAHNTTIPGTRQSFHYLERLLRIGLWASFRHRHRHLLRQHDAGRG